MKTSKTIWACIALTLICLPAIAQDWPQFLGPNADAKSDDDVPTQWSNDKNLVWKFDLPGQGSSSPIVIGDRVIVTCYSGSDRSMTKQIVCVNKVTGKEMWTKEISVDYREDAYTGYLKEHGYASNTPVSDGESLFVFFGKGGVFSFDLDGNQNWKVEVGQMSSNRRWGSAASLVLYNDFVIVNAAEEGRAIVALNKSDGKQAWKADADMLELAFGTPRLVTVGNDKTELVISVPGEIWGLNPDSGDLSWYCETQLTGNVSPSVVVDGDMIYSFGGYRSNGSLAVKCGGKENVTSENRKWTSRSTSYVATPLLHDNVFYWIDDRGLANASSAKDGQSIYRERVSGLTGRPVYASPVMVGENIFVVTRRAGTIVYKPGDSFSEVSRNVFEGDNTDFNASPAVSENRMYLRSNQALYCIGEK